MEQVYLASTQSGSRRGERHVFGQSTIGLVKMTKVSESDSDDITMDLTVRQR
ncbi:hypothetical protein [Nonomuraea aurantiaca]|uniref:hypothetical protein n=1 Tax=Nonomuraea aurantiaca TaxID=2878562 RepID=UPI001CDA2A09|nr:hypothetical protein [Nonomuraea aurantiaca]MCA2222087.1 hypothetical protein [Nonomuraea aurantiaca]